jgi:hypothetical protein
MQAHNQWATRPADERFWDLDEMLTATKRFRAECCTAHVPYDLLRAENVDGSVKLIGPAGNPSAISHYAFGQICRKVGAPADYLRRVGPELAAQCLTHGLERADGDAALMLRQTEAGLETRAALTDAYTRVWNCDIVQRVAALQRFGFRTPPARPAPVADTRSRVATEADVLQNNSGIGASIGVRVGDRIGPAGLYASDRDMFIFMVSEASIANPLDPSTPLNRGFFIWNSEVGDKTFGLMTFLYDAVCGNHIVWGASDVTEIKIRHVGTADAQAWNHLQFAVRRYANTSTADDQAKLAKAQSFCLGATKDEAVSALLGLVSRRKLDVTQTECHEAYAIAEKTPRYGDPRTAWAVAQGMTELSQRKAHTGDREKLDRAAGKVLEIAF